MHPDLVRAYVDECVTEVRSRVEGRPELGVIRVDYERDRPELFVHFDHQQHETETVTAVSAVILPNGQQLAQPRQIPILGGTTTTRRLILHMELDAFDLQPPTANLLGDIDQPLPPSEWPTSFEGRGIVANHPIYHRPFFCRRGLREYHSHQEHEDDPWDLWRDGLALHQIVTALLEGLRTRWHSAAA
jgi:hypothetical protein